uniref:F-box protein 16 n=1 Tax=Amazona collaria TaxID=241587 RepID=A0A8B9FJZ6_9PSIT
MAFAPPRNMKGPKLQTKMSTWTPLNSQLMNDKVFEERRVLLRKWFDKWTDGQRRRILVDLLERCSLSQQKFCAKQLRNRVPTEALDFTTRLPRVLSLYIFSFLDPRSLCRCAQVSWYWKYLSELDQLWMKKCLRFGWYINFTPTPFEQGIWKKHYIEMVKELHVTRPKTPSKDEFVVTDVQPIRSNIPEAKLFVPGKRTKKEKKELPPWRSSDRHPTDTIRFNYLNNYDPIEQARQANMVANPLCCSSVFSWIDRGPLVVTAALLCVLLGQSRLVAACKIGCKSWGCYTAVKGRIWSRVCSRAFKYSCKVERNLSLLHRRGRINCNEI